jgi:predicted RNase H-like HicB family nuclease
MNLPVIIESIKNNGYRAHVIGEPDRWNAEGATPEEALRRLESVVTTNVDSGVCVTSLSVPNRPDPLMKYAGTWKDHPLLGDWRNAIAEYREEIEKDPRAF